MVRLTNITLSLFVLDPFGRGPQITLEMGQADGTSPCKASVTWHAEPPHIVWNRLDEIEIRSPKVRLFRL